MRDGGDAGGENYFRFVLKNSVFLLFAFRNFLYLLVDNGIEIIDINVPLEELR